MSIRRRLEIFGAVVVTVLVIFLILISPLFQITQINVDGLIHISTEEVIGRLDVLGTSLPLFNSFSARRRLMNNFMIGEVSFHRQFPRTLYVLIVERRLTAFVEHMPGSFLYLDNTGRIMEVRNYMAEPLPILEGIPITHFQVGEMLQVPDTVAFGVVVHYTHLLRTHGLIERVRSVNVRDTSNIRILIYNIEFNVGGEESADEKIRTIIAILDALPNADTIRADVDLSEVGQFYPLIILR